MNRELLTLYGLKFNPFATDLPVEGLMPTPALDSFCRRIESQLVRHGGFAMIAGDPGTGKSVALRLLAHRLEHTEGLGVAVLTRPSASVADFYHELADLFGITLAHNNRWIGFKGLRQHWRAHLGETRLRPLLLVDEAQELGHGEQAVVRVPSLVCESEIVPANMPPDRAGTVMDANGPGAKRRTPAGSATL